MVTAAQGRGSESYTILNILHLLSGSQPPAAIAFPPLASRATTLDRGQGAAIARAPLAHAARAVHLTNGASICYVNAATGLGYVAHSDIGTLPVDRFLAAMQIIGAPPHADVYIALAHCGATAPGYQQTIADFAKWGIPAAHILEITGLYGSTFGLNNRFQIGY